MAQSGTTVSPPPPPCDSVVIVRCDRPAPPDADRRTDIADPFELERIVIEADPVRRSLAEALAGPFIDRAPRGTHTYATAEGALCTCMNRCPPIPFPCCQCSPHMNRYSVSPGASPLR